jgi:hypothetical protein
LRFGEEETATKKQSLLNPDEAAALQKSSSGYFDRAKIAFLGTSKISAQPL